MKKILLILICISIFACDKDESDENKTTPLGKWTQERVADNPRFKNSRLIVSKWGKITIELNQNDSCVYYVHNSQEGDIIIAKSLCTMDNKFITVKGGMFSPCENYYLFEGETILIYELTPTRMILEWDKEQIEKFIDEKLTSPTYFTELKRLK